MTNDNDQLLPLDLKCKQKCILPLYSASLQTLLYETFSTSCSHTEIWASLCLNIGSWGGIPISSGGRFELSIITPMPTLAAFNCVATFQIKFRSQCEELTLKWSISPETKSIKVGANFCSSKADSTLPMESSYALNVDIWRPYVAPSMAITSLHEGAAMTCRSAVTSTLSLNLCQ